MPFSSPGILCATSTRFLASRFRVRSISNPLRFAFKIGRLFQTTLAIFRELVFVLRIIFALLFVDLLAILCPILALVSVDFVFS